jgi:thioesterase domain-containing protein
LRDFSVRPYPGKLTLYRAADVPGFSGMDQTLGWGSIATEGVDVEFVPGDHVSMFKKPHVASLAYRLQSELQRAESHAIHG